MPTENLGQIAGLHIGTVAPTNTKMLWYDDNGGQKIVKYYDVGTTTWKAFDGVGVYVPIAGGTMTGPLVLNADPVVALGAATMAYVDAQVLAVAGTLSAVLTAGNTTGGTDISITASDFIAYNRGSGGKLDSAVTTGVRVWTLPDATGTLLMGTGTNNVSAIWSSGSLTDGVILDDGTTAGVGALDAAVVFNIDTATIVTAFKARTTVAAGVGVEGISNGATGGLHVGGDFTAEGSTNDTNIGVKGYGSSSGTFPGSIGGYFLGEGSTVTSIGAFGEYKNSGTLITGAGLFGMSNPVGPASGLNAGVAALTSEGDPGAIADIAAVGAALAVRYQGTGITTNRYGAHIEIVGSNSADNTALLLNAIAGANNYALITAGGFVGIGVAAPTKIFEVSDGDGVITLDTSAVTGAYNYDTVLTDTGVSLQTSVVKNLNVSLGGTVVSTHLSTGGLAVGVHTSVDSHLHVKFSGALADMDGGIRGTMSNSTPYVEATPAYANSLVLENEDITVNNTTAIVFRSKDTGSTTRDGAFMLAEYVARGATTVTAELVFGVDGKETLRTASGLVTIGGVSNESLLKVHGPLSLKQVGGTPSSASGYGGIHTRTDNNLYYVDDTDARYRLGNGGWEVKTTGDPTYLAYNKSFVLVIAAVCTVVLPAANLSDRVGVKAIAGTVTKVDIKTQTGEKIDGVIRSSTALPVVAQYDTFTFVSDGVDWFIESQP
jgi:hypothetical protein